MSSSLTVLRPWYFLNVGSDVLARESAHLLANMHSMSQGNSLRLVPSVCNRFMLICHATSQSGKVYIGDLILKVDGKCVQTLSCDEVSCNM